MDIELTSQRDEGTWTWRAAGARQPRGTLDAALLPPAAKVGDVLRAEVEGFLDGMNVVAVLPPKAPRSEPERLELLSRRSDDRLVTSSTEARGGRRRNERTRRAERSDHGRERSGRPGRERDRERSRSGPGRERGGDRRGAPESVPAADAKPKPKRLRPAKVHRTALLESLPAEQRPIAEQLIQGGIPAVRQAIEKQNKDLKAEGKTQVAAEPLLEIAERLRHRAQAAIWRDRADAALAHVDDLDLRDLRSVVNAAEDAGRDEESRTLAQQLREALGNRVEKEQAAWVSEVADNLREGRVVRALRLSSRPPKAGSPVPPDLAEQMVIATGDALTAETGSQRWATVLDALAYSPIRRRVVPSSLPEKVGPDLRETIARLGSRLPEIAHIFDIEPAAAPARPPRPTRPARQPRRRAKQGDGKPGDKARTNGRAARRESPADDAGKAPSNQDATPETDAAPQDEPSTTDAPDVQAPESQSVADTQDVDTPESHDAANGQEAAVADANDAEVPESHDADAQDAEAAVDVEDVEVNAADDGSAEVNAQAAVDEGTADRDVEVATVEAGDVAGDGDDSEAADEVSAEAGDQVSAGGTNGANGSDG